MLIIIFPFRSKIMCDSKIEKWRTHTNNATPKRGAWHYASLHHLSLSHQNRRWKCVLPLKFVNCNSHNGGCCDISAQCSQRARFESIILHSRCFLNFVCAACTVNVGVWLLASSLWHLLSSSMTQPSPSTSSTKITVIINQINELYIK